MPPSSTPTSAGRQTTLLGFFNKPTPGGSQSKPNTPSSSSRPAPKTPTLGTSSKPVAGSKTKQSVSRTGSNSNVLQQQAQAQSQESPLGNKGKSRGLVRTPSDEKKEKLGSAQSIRVEGEPIEIDLDTSVDLSMDLTMDTSMDVDLDLNVDNLDQDNDNNNKEEEEDVFTATHKAKTNITAGSTKQASSSSVSTPTSISASKPKPKGFTPLGPHLKPKPTVRSGPSGGISETSVGAGSSSPLSELEDLPETEISTSTSKSVPEVSKTDDVDVMDEEEAEESPIKMTVSHRCSHIRFAKGRQT
jgi:hypothetical protein